MHAVPDNADRVEIDYIVCVQPSLTRDAEALLKFREFGTNSIQLRTYEGELACNGQRVIEMGSFG